MILVPIGDFPEELLIRLSARAGIAIGPARIVPDGAWSAARRQYDSHRLLVELKRQFDRTVVGVTACDLFIPVLTFVFGEAELSGRVAIFSIHRLAQEFYGLPPDPELLEERAIRELWHEVGHMYGLPHCHDAFCVMSSSHSVERVDAKGEEFCPACMRRLSSGGQASARAESLASD